MVGRVWIADRGMASADNLAWLRQTGRRYIIGAPKSELKKFGSDLAPSRRLAHGPRRRRGQARLPSRDRRDRDPVPLRRPTQQRAGDARQVQPADRGMRSNAWLRRIARSKKRLDPATVNRQIGRILQQNQRAAARFAIALSRTAARRGFASPSPTTPRSTTGPLSQRAPISCARTSPIGAITALEGLHPAHPGGGRFSDPERSAEPASHLRP